MFTAIHTVNRLLLLLGLSVSLSLPALADNLPLKLMPNKTFADVQAEAQFESVNGPVYGNAPDPATLPFHATLTGTVMADATMTKLAIFSDDGCDVKVDGATVWAGKDIAQGLPDLPNSLHELPITLTPGSHTVEIDYSNVIYNLPDPQTGNPTDIDGCTLFVYTVAAPVVHVNTGAWQPDPATVGQPITSNVTTTVDNPYQSPNGDTISQHWTWTTDGVYESDTSTSGNFTPYGGDYEITWTQGSPTTLFTGTFSDVGYYIVKVTGTLTYHDDTTNADISTYSGDGYIGGAASDLAPPPNGPAPHLMPAHQAMRPHDAGVPVPGNGTGMPVGPQLIFVVDPANNTPLASDHAITHDMVRLHAQYAVTLVNTDSTLHPTLKDHYYTVKCSVQLPSGSPSNVSVILDSENVTVNNTPGTGVIEFSNPTNADPSNPDPTVAGSITTTLPLTLTKDGTPQTFYIVGTTASANIGDVQIVAHQRVTTDTDTTGAPRGTQPVTVFTFNNASITADPSTPGSTYARDDNNGVYTATGHAIELDALAYVSPIGLAYTAPQLKDLRIGIVQNGFGSYKLLWGKLDLPTPRSFEWKATETASILAGSQLLRTLSGGTAISPLNDTYRASSYAPPLMRLLDVTLGIQAANALTPLALPLPYGLQGNNYAPAHAKSWDTPTVGYGSYWPYTIDDASHERALEVDYNGLVKVAINNSFFDWVVVYNSDSNIAYNTAPQEVVPLAETQWSQNFSSTDTNSQISTSPAGPPAVTIPNVSTDASKFFNTLITSLSPSALGGPVESPQPPMITVPALVSVTVDSASVRGGMTIIGTLTLSSDAAPLGGVVIGLTSSDPAAQFTDNNNVSITQLTITTGTTATFKVTTSSVTAAKSVIISASQDMNVHTTTLTITP